MLTLKSIINRITTVTHIRDRKIVPHLSAHTRNKQDCEAIQRNGESVPTPTIKETPFRRERGSLTSSQALLTKRVNTCSVNLKFKDKSGMPKDKNSLG